MMGTAGIYAAAIVLALLGGPAAEQSGPDPAALRARIERRFDVLPLRDGFVLRPKTPGSSVRAIEVTDDAIALDGQPATGAELRRRLGADADLILQLSYLNDQERRSLLQTMSPSAGRPGAPEPPASPTPPTPPAAPLPPTPPEPPRRDREAEREARRARRESRDSDDRVHVGGSVTVRKDEVVDGDVVAVGGSATVDGTVRGDVVAIGGSVNLGPTADIENDVVAVGGTVHRDPAARIGGRVQEVGINFGRFRDGQFSLFNLWRDSMFGSAFRLAGTLARLGILCLLAALVVLFGREYMERAGTRAVAEPLKAGAIGLLAQLLFVPVLVITIVLLAVTIVGIPLLVLVPFAILGLVVIALVGFTGVSYKLGLLLGERLGWNTANPYLTTIMGVVLLVSPIILARVVGLGGFPLFPITGTLVAIGLLAEYAAWTVGFGAMALMRFAKPPLPEVPAM
jgi:hypothetical protein